MFIKGRKIMINMETIKIIKIERYSYCCKIQAYDFNNNKYTLLLIPDVEIKHNMAGKLNNYDIAKIIIGTIFNKNNNDIDLLEIADYFNEEYKIKNKILTLI